MLDGFPKTLKQAEDLFTGTHSFPFNCFSSPSSRNAEPADDKGEEGDLKIDEKIFPQFVFTLEGNDEFLRRRVMALPESEVAGTHNNEQGFVRRLKWFRENNTDDNTVLSFFDKNDALPAPLKVSILPISPLYIYQNFFVQAEEPLSALLEQVIKYVGKPHNYGPTKEEIAEIERKEREAKVFTGYISLFISLFIFAFVQ